VLKNPRLRLLVIALGIAVDILGITALLTFKGTARESLGIILAAVTTALFLWVIFIYLPRTDKTAPNRPRGSSSKPRR